MNCYLELNYPKESGIYKIQNKINNKCYIGQSQNIEHRIKTHLCLLNNNNHYNIHLQKAWNKYGFASFDISVLKLCDVSELDKYEIEYIEKYDSFINGYNRTKGGDGVRGMIVSEESRNKMKEAHADFSGSKHPRAKSIVLLNTKEIFLCIKDAAEKYHVSRADISGCAKGKTHYAGRHNNEKLVWVYKCDYDLMPKHDIDELIFMANNHNKKSHSPHAKPVICISTGEIFGCISDAASCYGISNSVIGAACNGVQKYAGKNPNTGEKLIWSFYEEQSSNYANGEN